jgi:hypothetical protein
LGCAYSAKIVERVWSEGGALGYAGTAFQAGERRTRDDCDRSWDALTARKLLGAFGPRALPSVMVVQPFRLTAPVTHHDRPANANTIDQPTPTRSTSQRQHDRPTNANTIDQSRIGSTSQRVTEWPGNAAGYGVQYQHSRGQRPRTRSPVRWTPCKGTPERCAQGCAESSP